MTIEQFKCPHRAKNFSYVISSPSSNKIAIVDPSFCDELLATKLTEAQYDVQYIINTHAHFDHTWGNDTLKNIFPKAKLIAHTNTKYKPNASSVDIAVEDGESIWLDQLEIKILHTPGHTPEDICLLVNNSLITGDTLFVGKVGGTRDRETAKTQFESLKKLMQLPQDTKIYPGHNYGPSPSSTIQAEKEANPFCLRLDNFENFYWLKENWKTFKEKHNLD
ncbi:hydroxyacylglutathione hydrolase family protein [Natranaerobius thermophilus]|uniref:Beta-lactamase domain protein n=1 Tax=Natranaerobius thermophilus (strain ATCC BAA-1301 / DSM 18059 / JW/NM-WN-LF) TaxID=457570 RepID=B2A6N0_NATTJ|nr:hydroxyacylglutathione hydrolase family protein [Natranaerobius thermophilus]ACB84163.1 beta-lactamase domain protein [Natranaerobius thermophilus JW/NM-WN-LF]